MEKQNEDKCRFKNYMTTPDGDKEKLEVFNAMTKEEIIDKCIWDYKQNGKHILWSIVISLVLGMFFGFLLWGV